MKVSGFLLLRCAATIAIFSLAVNAHAGTVCTAGTCTTIIPGDPTAANSNFGSPGATANVGYTIMTSDSGGYFQVVSRSVDPHALEFSNLYFDTIASTPNTGSNLGFEFGQGTEDAFDPNSGVKYSLAGLGFSSVFTQTGGVTTGTVEIPNSFFLTNPDGMPFTPTPSGSLVSLHLSQTFGYSVVGGSANFPAPVELGDATISSATVTPEPSSLVLLGSGVLSLAGFARRKMRG